MRHPFFLSHLLRRIRCHRLRHPFASSIRIRCHRLRHPFFAHAIFLLIIQYLSSHNSSLSSSTAQHQQQRNRGYSSSPEQIIFPHCFPIVVIDSFTPKPLSQRVNAQAVRSYLLQVLPYSSSLRATLQVFATLHRTNASYKECSSPFPAAEELQTSG